ncbi:MAG: hypothetical protein JWR11_454 [Mycobacterium sp.]|nr:hypothetical protein [Mycobacterium sp.]
MGSRFRPAEGVLGAWVSEKMQLEAHWTCGGAWWGKEVAHPAPGAGYGVSGGKEKGQLLAELP